MLYHSTKPIILNLTLAAFAVIIFITSILNRSTDQTNQNLGLASPHPTMNQQPQIEIIVPSHGNFSLQSPGLLPSHPLYKVKMIKDRLRLIFTLNPEKHTRLLLTYSNIRMSAANELIMQGYTDLAVTTAIKGQTYLWQAISHSQKIDFDRQPQWYDSLKLTLLKHEEIIEKIRFVAKDNRRYQADRLWNQLGDYRQHVSNLSGTPFNYPRPEDILVNPSEEPYL